MRQIASAEVAVEQAHHAFDKNQIGLLGRLIQTLAHIPLARHPQIHRMHGRTAGQLVPIGIQKIRPALEYAYLASLARMQASQGSRDGGLALAGGRSTDQQRRATRDLSHCKHLDCTGHPSSRLPLQGQITCTAARVVAIGRGVVLVRKVGYPGRQRPVLVQTVAGIQVHGCVLTQ